MPYIKTLTTNVKGPKRTYQLGKNLVLYGPNQSGKSAIAQSLQLALTGACTGVMFRGQVKTGETILTMGESSGIDIDAVTNEGDHCTYTALPGKRPAWKAKQAPCLDIEAVRAAFSGSTSKLADFLRAYCPVDMVAVDKDKLIDLVPTSNGLRDDLLSRVANLECDSTGKKWTIPSVISILALLETIQKDAAAAGKVSATISDMFASASYDERIQPIIMAGEAFVKETITNAVVTAKANNDAQALSNLRGAVTLFGGAEVIKRWSGVNAIRLQFGQYYTNKIKSDLYREHLTNKSAQEAIVGLCKRTITAIEELLDTYTNGCAGWLATMASAFLHSNEALAIDAKEGRVYLITDGVARLALSGSTEARVLAAITSALVVDTDIGLVLLDDRMWDAQTLAATMRALSACPVQVVIMTTVMPRGRRNPDWTTITLGTPEADTDGAQKQEDAQENEVEAAEDAAAPNGATPVDSTEDDFFLDLD